ncbi:unnamed protein product [Bursaphelenchus xylophilus]|uniref:Palmitoyltransferase n=1 Tax=Bursaphelenchus xylophilus TaxID=6326 RepID=A0A1I7SLJ9_BURXY|nr:unnamed protein product [Bursaphelenchus xylophilus]CAG9129648.1 unnamed protein product [Bursaphelenchus xylophilus]
MDIGKAERMKTVQEVIKETKKHVKRLQTQDIVSIVCVTTILPLGYLIEITYVLSFWFELFSDQWFLRVLPLTMIALNVYFNIVQMFRVGPNGFNTELPTIQKQGFRYCHQCQLNSPPRAYHCPSCDTCVLRRDHHCSFAAICVGHFNQRYFVAAILNLWIVMAVCATWNFYFVTDVVSHVKSIPTVWQVMVPHLALMMGYLTFYQFLSVFFFVSSVTALMFVTYLVAAQVFCIYRGQTRVEYLLNIYAYNLGFRENLKQCLGQYWILALISPFLPSPLPSDGISFRTFDSDDISKTTKFL